MKKLILPNLIFFALCSLACAQDTDEPELREYVVEILVFRNLESSYLQETFPKQDTFGEPIDYEFLDGQAEEPPIEYSDPASNFEIVLETDETSENIDDETLELEPEESIYGEFRRLPETFLALSSMTERLDQASGYLPILHTAWIQPGYARDDALLEPIEVLSDFESMTGTATLTISNYIHLDMDLLVQTEDQTLYQLREKRKMRRDETHYFDHPHLGVIATVRRLEDVAPELQGMDEILEDELPESQTTDSVSGSVGGPY